ncbi:hypothetical protein PV682_27575 [Streptomyces niveiscabiei]|uniref:hypothetical protein n=1 Tax=Streptomyces niveiscabiei TaxID=164115 RepID=UPI0029AC2B9F|nr:hypothetical protein [Streptomyces niveiscabiei]MDX3385208.1 hypothetical protein [Streptomyces niveiscabiei]
MTFDPNTLIAPVVGLVAVPLGACVNARATVRAEVKAERDNLGAQFDAMFVAVAQLRDAVDEDRILWSNGMEKVRAGILAGMADVGLAAFIRGADRRQLAAVLGGASWVLSQERIQQKAATSSITPKATAVTQASAPLIQHSDLQVRETAERVMAAAYGYHEAASAAELEAAPHAFGVAVRAAAQPTPGRWRRRRELQPGADAG